MDCGPKAVRILQSRRDLIPVGRLVGLQCILGLCLDAEGDAEIADIADRIALLRKDLRERLTGVLVVVGNLVVEIGLDGLEHRGPIRPLRWAVVTDDVSRFGRLPRRHQRKHQQWQDKTDGLHEGNSGFKGCPRSGDYSTNGVSKYRAHMNNLRRSDFALQQNQEQASMASANSPETNLRICWMLSKRTLAHKICADNGSFRTDAPSR